LLLFLDVKLFEVDYEVKKQVIKMNIYLLTSSHSVLDWKIWITKTYCR